MLATADGTELDHRNVRRAFRAIVYHAGLDATAWTPRELRHSFVSILSDSGVPIRQIARPLGHSGTAVTERVDRHPLRPVLEEGAATSTACSRATTRDRHSDGHSAGSRTRQHERSNNTI